MVNRNVGSLPIAYSSKPVTPFGGMSLMKRFVDQVVSERSWTACHYLNLDQIDVMTLNRLLSVFG